MYKIKTSVKKIAQDLHRVPLPRCTLHAIRTFLNIVHLSNQASLSIRTNYLDIWHAYIKRPRRQRVAMFEFSSNLNRLFGRQRVSEFHELCQRRRDLIEWVRSSLVTLKAELSLINCPLSELKTILEWVQQVNTGEQVPKPNSWVNYVSAKHMSEIAIWRLVNLPE